MAGKMISRAPDIAVIVGAILAIIGGWLMMCDRRNEFIGPFLIGAIACLAVWLII